MEDEDEENWLPVPSKECVPLWPLYGGRNYVCRVAGTREATVPFSALDPNPSLLMLANKYGGIDVRSKLDSAQVESWETKNLSSSYYFDTSEISCGKAKILHWNAQISERNHNLSMSWKNKEIFFSFYLHTSLTIVQYNHN